MDWVLTGKLVYDLALAASCAFAIGKGGTWERVGAAVAVLGTGATALVPPLVVNFGIKAPLLYLGIDVAVLVAFDAIMIRSAKFWPIWATGIQLAAVTLGVTTLLEPGLRNQFVLVQGKFAYPILLSLVLGSLEGRRQGAD